MKGAANDVQHRQWAVISRRASGAVFFVRNSARSIAYQKGRFIYIFVLYGPKYCCLLPIQFINNSCYSSFQEIMCVLYSIKGDFYASNNLPALKPHHLQLYGLLLFFFFLKTTNKRRNVINYRRSPEQHLRRMAVRAHCAAAQRDN